MPTDTLADAIDAMTTRINDAQTAADLNAAAFAALSPEMMAAAIALGIFRAEVAATGSTAGMASGGGGRNGSGEGRGVLTGTSGGDPVNATGGAIVWASDAGGRLQFRTANSGRDIYSVRDFPHRRGAVLAWLAANSPGGNAGTSGSTSQQGGATNQAGQGGSPVNVMVVIGQDEVESTVETANQRSRLTGR